MATIAPPKKPITVLFPKAEVVAHLVAELTNVAVAEAGFRGITLPKGSAQLLKAAVPMDSLTVVDALCVIEPVIGFELRDSTVRTGGYNSIQSALDHLVPRIEKAWLRKNGVKP